MVPQLDHDKILSVQRGSALFLTLNRPAALNAVDMDMVHGLHTCLSWAQDNDKITDIILKSNHPKAFCAGGDIRRAYEARKEGHLDFSAFFKAEYLLNYLLSCLTKSFVAVIDGIAMGGGLGISVNGQHRVVTQRAILAMPETAIGFFPDVGGTFFLNKAPGHMGLYLGLTGQRLTPEDALMAGLATHFLESSKLENFYAKCEEVGIEASLRELSEKNTLSQDSVLASNVQEIETYFSAASLKEIMLRLEATSTPFAQRTLETLRLKSPTSLQVTFRQLTQGRSLPLKMALEREYGLAQVFMKNHDFYEGVRALLVDKDNAPKWVPKYLKDVDERQVDAYFIPSESPLFGQ